MQVRAVVAEAAEINLHNADIDSLTRLVKGSYDRFLAEQFKKAKRCKHHSRAIRVALKQKSREFNKSNTNLRMSDFSLLKQPMAWTKERFHWGSDTTRAANMLKFQEAHLHSPLTTSLFGNTDKLYVKLVTARILATFDTVQKAMGQRNTRNMDLRLYELVRDGLEYPEVRDECYLHLFKQLQDNKMIAQGRGTEQTANAFEMLAFCLCVFPPSESLEPYLEQWIRESSNKVYSEQYNLPGLLRRRMYFGTHVHMLHIILPAMQFLMSTFMFPRVGSATHTQACEPSHLFRLFFLFCCWCVQQVHLRWAKRPLRQNLQWSADTPARCTAAARLGLFLARG